MKMNMDIKAPENLDLKVFLQYVEYSWLNKEQLKLDISWL